MTEKILFVDDESAVLDGYKRVLHQDFHPDIALGGSEALNALSSRGPYAIVVSDMRMPGMNGVELLSRVRELSPNTVRVILTGYADLDSAMNAVNEGQVFRFLTKPCEAALLRKALTTCLVQYRLVTAEKDLLENTLMGSIKVLTDVLSLANPAAFGRAVRVRRYVQHIVQDLQLDSPWRYEVAAMLSQLGCVTLPHEVIEAAYCGKNLSPEDQASFDKHPQVAHDLLQNIPRLDGIAWIVGHQRDPENGSDAAVPESIRIGAAILRAALLFDELKISGQGDTEALAQLQVTHRTDPRIVRALAGLPPATAQLKLRAVRISELTSGMILQEEIRTNVGMLLVGRGQEVTHPLIVRLNNFHQRRAIPDRVLVLANAD